MMFGYPYHASYGLPKRLNILIFHFDHLGTLLWRAFSSIWRPLIAPLLYSPRLLSAVGCWAEQHLAFFRGEGDSPPLTRRGDAETESSASLAAPSSLNVSQTVEEGRKIKSAWCRLSLLGEKTPVFWRRANSVGYTWLRDVFFLSRWVFIVDSYACVLHRTGEKTAPDPPQTYFRSGRLLRGTRRGERAPRALGKHSEPWTTAGWWVMERPSTA